MTLSPNSLLYSAAQSAKREWPFTLGILTLLIAHITYYGLLGNEWRIGGLPFLIAIVVLIVAELTRQLLNRYRE